MNVLAVVAHPDDELLCMGGTLLRHTAQKDNVFVLCLTDGILARRTGKDAIVKQQESFHNSLKMMRVKNWVHSRFENEKLDVIPLLEIVREIEYVLKSFEAETIYTHTAADLNQDHRRTLEAVLVAARPLPGKSVKRILCAPATTGRDPIHPFHPNYYMNITEWIKWKLFIFSKAYPQEVREYPHPSSLAALEQAGRAAAIAVGQEGYYEEFELIRSAQ